MPNLIAGRQIVPELLQDDLNPQRLSSLINELISDRSRLGRMRADLDNVRGKLGEARASERAAQKILELLM
jgi:lipid-A-disaccharide synthase